MHVAGKDLTLRIGTLKDMAVALEALDGLDLTVIGSIVMVPDRIQRVLLAVSVDTVDTATLEGLSLSVCGEVVMRAVSALSWLWKPLEALAAYCDAMSDQGEGDEQHLARLRESLQFELNSEGCGSITELSGLPWCTIVRQWCTMDQRRRRDAFMRQQQAIQTGVCCGTMKYVELDPRKFGIIDGDPCPTL